MNISNNNCRVCNNHIEPFMDFGKMPIANGFLTSEQFKNEYFFDMQTAFCNNCKIFQLIYQPEADLMFNENYPFFSSLSKYMKIHFNNFSDYIIKNHLLNKKDPFVIELGSNDGIMLANFKNKKIKHLGIEPSSNVAGIAISKGIKTISEFFDEDLAKKIVDKYGKADAIFSANCMCHISNINSVMKGISILLKNDGILAFEDPYLGDMLEKTSYDQVYDEHVYIFSATSVSNIAKLQNLELIDLERQVTHGGSMRYIIAPNGSKNISHNVKKILNEEDFKGLNSPKRYDHFKKQCELSRENLKNTLEKMKENKKRVIGYGATSKSTTILNYSKIDKELIEYISDTTPLKQNKFSPGMHIPIKDYYSFSKNFPDYSILFAWNHKKEIFEKEKNYMQQGGKWINFVPKVIIE